MLIRIILIILLVSPCYADHWFIPIPVGVVACEVTASVAQEVADDYWNVLTNTAQKIKYYTTKTICKVDVHALDANQDAVCHIEVWPSSDMTGSQIGGDSDPFTITSTTGDWFSATWSSNEPAPTVDHWIFVVWDSGGTQPVWDSSTDQTDYEDTDYDAWREGSEIADDNDFTFRIYYRQ